MAWKDWLATNQSVVQRWILRLFLVPLNFGFPPRGRRRAVPQSLCYRRLVTTLAI